MDEYYDKYVKYKQKYLELKYLLNQTGGKRDFPYRYYGKNHDIKKLVKKCKSLINAHRTNIKLVDDSQVFIEDYRRFKTVNSLTDVFNEHCRMKCKKRNSISPYEYFLKNPNKKYHELVKKKDCSLFRVLIAIQILKHFNVKTWLDMSAGWGDRLIAAILKKLDYYFSTDPNMCLHEGYNKIKEAFEVDKSKFVTVNEPFEKAIIIPPETGKFDLFFSSPPFFYKEIYDNNNDGQSTKQYRDIDDWIDNFLLFSIKKALPFIKLGGKIVLYIEDTDETEYVDKFINSMEAFVNLVPNRTMYYKYLDMESKKPLYIWTVGIPVWIFELKFDGKEYFIENETSSTVVIDTQEKKWIYKYNYIIKTHSYLGSSADNKKLYFMRNTLPIHNKVYRKPIDIIKFSLTTKDNIKKNLTVLSDNNLLFGTKMRAVIQFLDKIKPETLIYSGSHAGRAQLLLAYYAVLRNVKRLILCVPYSKSKIPKLVKSMYPNVEIYSYEHTDVAQIIKQTNFEKLHEYAIKLEKQTKGYLLPFDFRDDDFIDMLAKELELMIDKSLLDSPIHLLLAYNAGTTFRALTKIFKKAYFHIVQIGQQFDVGDLDDDIIERTTRYVSSFRFKDDYDAKNLQFVNDNQFVEFPYTTVEKWDAKVYEFIDKIPSDDIYVFDAGACHKNILKKYNNFYKLNGEVDDLQQGYNSRQLITNVHTFKRSLTYDKKTNSLIVERLKSNDFLNEINEFSKSSDVYPIIEIIKLLNSIKICDLTIDDGFILIATFLTNGLYIKINNGINDKMLNLFNFLQVNTNKYTITNSMDEIGTCDTIFIDKNTDITDILPKIKLGTYVISNNNIDLSDYSGIITKIKTVEYDASHTKFHIWKYGIPVWIENVKIKDIDKIKNKITFQKTGDWYQKFCENQKKYSYIGINDDILYFTKHSTSLSELINKKINILNFNTNNKNITVFDDSEMLFGSKMRAIIEYLDNYKFDTLVLFDFDASYGQIVVAYYALIRSISRVIFMLPLKNDKCTQFALSIFPNIEIYSYEDIKLDPSISNFRNLKMFAETIAKETNGFLIPTGLKDSLFINILAKQLKEHIDPNLLNKNIDILMVYGSGTIYRTLTKIFTNAKFHIVQSGAESKIDDMPKEIVERTTRYISTYDFRERIDLRKHLSIDRLPYSTIDNYDAKVYEFIDKINAKDIYVFNVGGSHIELLKKYNSFYTT